MKLNQAIAIANGEKSKAQSVMSALYHKLQKTDLFEGFTKRYKPLDEDSKETMPEENKIVQMNVREAIREGSAAIEKLLNIVGTIDIGNTEATADVVVGGKTILSKVPATNLIFLEKQLVDLKTFVEKFPTLDSSETWESLDEVTFKSQGRITNRTLKQPFSFTKAKATDKHPEQAEILYRDEVVGKFETVRFSGACTKAQKNEYLERIENLSKAVKIAREEANFVEVKKVDFGTSVTKYIFG